MFQVNRPLTMIKTQIHSRRRKPTKSQRPSFGNLSLGTDAHMSSQEGQENSNNSDQGMAGQGDYAALDMSHIGINSSQDLDSSMEDQVQMEEGPDQFEETESFPVEPGVIKTEELNQN